MFERDNDKNGTGRLRTALAIAAVTAVVASMAIVGTVAAQPGQRFFDVPRTHYAYDSIEWAVVNGITQGCGDGRNFCPEQTLNRAHMVTFLKRYHDRFGSSTSSGTGDDNGDLGEWTLADTGPDDKSINLSAGEYRIHFMIEDVGSMLSDFMVVTLTAEGGREEVLCRVNTSVLVDVDFDASCRKTIEVGSGFRDFDPGSINFDVGITPKADIARARVFDVDWAVEITER